MEKKVVIRFLFKSSPHALEIVVTESEAKGYIKKRSEDFVGYFAGYDKEQDRHWLISATEIASIITLPHTYVKNQEEAQKKYMTQALQNKTYPPYGYGGPSMS